MTTGCTAWPICDRTVTTVVDDRERYCQRHAIWWADRAVRLAVLARDGGRCVSCGAEGNSLDWAHIRSRGAHPTLRYDLDNAMALCRGCHGLFHRDPRAHAAIVAEVFGPDHYNQLGLRSIARDRRGEGIDLAEVIRGARDALMGPPDVRRYRSGRW